MKYLIFNFKDNLSYANLPKYHKILKKYQKDIIICPSFLYLDYFQKNNYITCAQDISLFPEGNFTGEVSGKSLKEINCSYTLVGHFERRYYLKEKDEDLILKTKEAIKNNLKVIYCLNISKNTTIKMLYKQIDNLFSKITTKDISNIIFAYEPFYLIGTNKKINISKINQDIINIKDYVLKKYQYKIKIIYGGSVNLNNLSDLQTLSKDGFLIGEASTKVDSLLALLETLFY